MVNAHIIPRSFFEVVKGKGKYSVGFLIKKEVVETPYQQAGPSDNSILGICCEPRFANWDSYGFEILGRRQWAESSRPDSRERPGAYEIRNVDYDNLSLFILSVLWRANVSKHLLFDNVDLGIAAEPIRKILLSGAAPDPAEFAIILAATLNPKYPNVILRPDRFRVGGINYYRIYFPNIFVLIKVDKRSAPFPIGHGALRRSAFNYIFHFPYSDSPFRAVEKLASVVRRRRWVGKGRHK